VVAVKKILVAIDFSEPSARMPPITKWISLSWERTVMGTHGHGPAFRMATGSIADLVLGSAACAVLAVKGGRHSVSTTCFDPVAAVTSA